jgi:hypothetical protein
MFVLSLGDCPGKPFHPNLMFASKARAYPSEAPLSSSWPYLQTLDQAGMAL